MLIENLLRSKEYWEIVDNGVSTLRENTMTEQRKFIDDGKIEDLKAKNYLFQALDRGVVETILKSDTSKDI